MELEPMKTKLALAMSRVSDTDFEEATSRWLAGFNAETMIDNFISILDEYREENTL